MRLRAPQWMACLTGPRRVVSKELPWLSGFFLPGGTLFLSDGKLLQLVKNLEVPRERC